MGDVSELYRRALKTLHRDGATTQAQERKDFHNKARKFKRETEVFFRRNIDENMSPAITPVSTPVPEKTVLKPSVKAPEYQPEKSTINISHVPNKRLEMLQKWKLEKEKQKAVEKSKAKPLFKVYHVQHEVVPNLENVNKVIKGKPFSNTSKFAPINHKFTAPSNLRPVPLSHGPKLDILSFIKSHGLDVPERVKKSPPKKAKVEAAKTRPVLRREASTRNVQSRVKNGLVLNKAASSANFTEKVKSQPVLSRAHSAKNLTTQPKNAVVRVAATTTNLKRKIETPKQATVSGSTATSIETQTAKSTTSKASSKNLLAKSSKRSPTKLAENLAQLKITSPKKSTRNKKVTNNVHSTFNNDKVNMVQDSAKPKVKQGRAVSQDSTVSSTITGYQTQNSNENGSELVKEQTNNNSGKQENNLKLDNKSSKPNLRNRRNSAKSNTSVFDNHEADKPTESKTPRKTVGFSGQTPKENKSLKKSVGFSVDSVGSKTTTPNSNSTKNKLAFRKTPIRKTKDLESVSNSNSSLNSSRSYRSASDDYPIDSSSDLDKSMGADAVFVTPQKSTEESPTVYVSPFVTISRGKQSARKEYEIRKSFGNHTLSPDESQQYTNFVNKNTSPKAAADYFTKKLDGEIRRIELMCAEWQDYLDGTKVPEESKDSIDVTIGQSRLLIAKKFQQFRGLIQECRTNSFTEKPITCEDLHGFWDMLYMQVEDLDKRFNNLQTMKQNGWIEILPQKSKPAPAAKRGRGRPKKNRTNSKIKDLIAAARLKKSAEPTINSAEPCLVKGTEDKVLLSEEKLFVGGYFEIRSPLVTKEGTPGQRKSLNRLSVLTAENKKKRCSSSPGLVMLKISQAIKQGGGLTPAKSILKSENSMIKSTGKKSVLFKEDLVSTKDCKAVLFGSDSDNEEDAKLKKKTPENKENIFSNIMTFSPGTPLRRSARLSRSNK